MKAGYDPAVTTAASPCRDPAFNYFLPPFNNPRSPVRNTSKEHAVIPPYLINPRVLTPPHVGGRLGSEGGGAGEATT